LINKRRANYYFIIKNEIENWKFDISLSLSKIKQDFSYRDGDIIVQKNQGSVDASKFALISHFDEGCLRFFQIRAAELKIL
jgi:hypothetical protein